MQYSVRRTRSAGFTLIELMMVVAIMGVLAAIAIPQYKSYLYRAKTTEAVGFLAEVKARQESYRADFGQYCDVSQGSSTAWFPTATPSAKYQSWDATTEMGKRWAVLGAVPPGRQVLFSYVTVAGNPGTTPSWGGGLGYTGQDFWFVSRALGDLDGDGVRVTFESYSHGQGLYIDQPTGWE